MLKCPNCIGKFWHMVTEKDAKMITSCFLTKDKPDFNRDIQTAFCKLACSFLSLFKSWHYGEHGEMNFR